MDGWGKTWYILFTMLLATFSVPKLSTNTVAWHVFLLGHSVHCTILHCVAGGLLLIWQLLTTLFSHGHSLIWAFANRTIIKQVITMHFVVH